MPVLPIPLSKGLVTSNLEADWLDSLPTNMLAVPKPVLEANGYMRSWPGFDKTIDVPGTSRGAVFNDVEGQVFRVNGTSLIDGTGLTLAEVGGSGHASLPFSRNSQAVVSNGRLLFWSDNELTELVNWKEGERERDEQEGVMGDINYTVLYDGQSTYVEVDPWVTTGNYQITATIFLRDTEEKQWVFATTSDSDQEGGIFVENGHFFVQADQDTDAVQIQEAVEGLNEFDYSGSVNPVGGIATFGAIRQNDTPDDFLGGQIYSIRFNDLDPPNDDEPNNRSYTATIRDDEVPTNTILLDERSDGEEFARESLVEVTGGTPAAPAESDEIVRANRLTIGDYYVVACEVVTSGSDASGFSDRNGIGTEARVNGGGDVETVFQATARNQVITVFTQNSQASFRNVVVQQVTHGIINQGIWEPREEEENEPSELPGTDFALSNIIDATRNRSRYAFIQAGSNRFGVTDLQNEQRPDYIAPFYSAEAEPGINIAIDSWRDYVVIFTRDTVEYFALTGINENIYQPVQSLNVRAGIIGLTCKTHYLDTFAILGGPRPEPPSVFIISNGQYREIANRRVQKYLREYTEEELETAYLETIKFDAHDILIMHLPRHTLTYDDNASDEVARWSILKTDVQGDATYRGIYHLYDGATWTLGDKRDNILSRFNFESAGHVGERVEFLLDTPMVQLRNVRLFDLDVDNIPGRANTAYRVAVSLTYDGITYGQEHWTEFDTLTEYTRRVLIRVLGYTRYNVGFRLRWISDTPSAISNLRVRAEK